MLHSIPPQPHIARPAPRLRRTEADVVALPPGGSDRRIGVTAERCVDGKFPWDRRTGLDMLPVHGSQGRFRPLVLVPVTGRSGHDAALDPSHAVL